MKMIEIEKDDRKLHVTEKAFKVVYAAFGYRLVGEVGVPPVPTEGEASEVDLYDLSREELEKVKKDDIKTFLDKEGIDYDASALKPELIKIVLGEE